MLAVQALLILAGLILWLLAAFGVPTRVSLVLVGAILIVLGYTLPIVAGGLHQL